MEILVAGAFSKHFDIYPGGKRLMALASTHMALTSAVADLSAEAHELKCSADEACKGDMAHDAEKQHAAFDAGGLEAIKKYSKFWNDLLARYASVVAQAPLAMGDVIADLAEIFEHHKGIVASVVLGYLSRLYSTCLLRRFPKDEGSGDVTEELLSENLGVDFDSRMELALSGVKALHLKDVLPPQLSSEYDNLTVRRRELLTVLSCGLPAVKNDVLSKDAVHLWKVLEVIIGCPIVVAL